MKIYLIALLSFLIAPISAFAALDVTLSESSVISVGGYNLVVNGSADIDSISVDISDFSVVLSSGASFTVTSADRKAFTVSPSSLITSQTCSATQSLVTVGMTSGSVTTVTITPTSNTCTSAGGSAGGGTSPRTITPAPSSSSSVASSQSTVAVIPSATPATSVANPSSVARSVSPVFTRDLIRGSKGEDVRNLQKLLAKDKSIYPEGLVTGLFGPLTEKAVKKFQAKYNLPQVGKVSSATRELLTIVSSISDSSPASPSVAQSSSVSSKSSAKKAAAKTIVKALKKGMKDDQVSTLQQWLSKDKEIYPEATVSGYYGSLTEKSGSEIPREI